MKIRNSLNDYNGMKIVKQDGVSIYWLGYMLDDPSSKPGRQCNFSPLKSERGSGVHPASCSMGTGVISRG